MRSPGTQITALYGRRWRLILLWYVEGCAAGAGVWTLTHDARPQTFVAAFAYFLLCGAALALPAHILRHLLTTAGVPPAYRRLALQLLLAFAAAATAATLSTAQGWAAIVFILLVGDALWALELELRMEAAEDARGA
jgi:NhaP-type Na+/H+ or K+/H+ antiporter